MKKVGLFKSVHLKFILIYVLLILLAMQIIGVYFVQKLEEHLVTNFTNSVNSRVQLLAYSVEKEFSKVNEDELPTIEEGIHQLLRDYSSDDISEIQVIDDKGKVMSTSNVSNQGIIGKRTTEIRVKQTLLSGTESKQVLVDPINGHRMWVLIVPIKTSSETEGVIYVEASMEQVYEQMRDINGIFSAGTFLALLITVVLGVLLARAITRPISDMQKQALVMSEGDFSRNVRVYSDDEIGQLAITFNELTLKLQDAQATTEDERRKLTSVLEHMSDGLLATDRDGVIILVNDPAVDMIGVSRETIFGKTVSEVLGLDDEVVITELDEENQSILIDLSKRNKPYILRANFSPILKDNELNGYITVLQDVTEQEKIEQERREFVANVSHELRTPLTTMRSYLEALTDGAWKNENIAPRFLDVTQNETERMIRLVNALLQLSKLDSKDYHMDFKKVDFASLFEQVIERFEMTKAQNVKFKKEFKATSVQVTIDQDKLTQVLDNIISNALKYSPKGGTVCFTLEADEKMLKVCVRDEGMGIPKENLTKVFERFYRVDKARSRKMGGTGLGLAIAKEIIELHGGKVWAESVEGEGTAIFFTLPLGIYSEVEEQ
ncbi:cell wall metabolism sensor histidine kinase WalK [Bacillus solimangrovi]|uniref:histidine kinase n=1 Tax=Bacillus solimangrovi TaxID=1305675 RepID=A0A1E5LG66_9BACI|nr:cell wall metabolism sensor histidine kinase WalK [Bacillus solimangrovi]OEH93078.1 PAS domain-containing sensor histidine kinase [Bacillus solimangrovi]